MSGEFADTYIGTFMQESGTIVGTSTRSIFDTHAAVFSRVGSAGGPLFATRLLANWWQFQDGGGLFLLVDVRVDVHRESDVAVAS